MPVSISIQTFLYIKKSWNIWNIWNWLFFTHIEAPILTQLLEPSPSSLFPLKLRPNISYSIFPRPPPDPFLKPSGIHYLKFCWNFVGTPPFSILGTLPFFQSKNLPHAEIFSKKMTPKKYELSKKPVFSRKNRRDRIWTCDFYVPNVALYQAEPHAENMKFLLAPWRPERSALPSWATRRYIW